MKKTVIGLMLCGAAALASCNLDTIPTDKYKPKKEPRPP